jgi:hypothetical protein
MNNLLPALALAALAVLPFSARAQDPFGAHRHDGFYLSLSPGIGSGSTVFSEDFGSADEVTFKGGVGAYDLKIGGAVSENLILSFDIIGSNMPGPDIESGSGTFETDEDIVLGSGSIGLGMTYYFMPVNVFLSGTLGVGKLRLREAPLDDDIDSETGLALHFKVGKEWWVSRNWGLGVSGGYGFLGVKNPPDNGADYQGEYASHRFYILFNTTYN